MFIISTYLTTLILYKYFNICSQNFPENNSNICFALFQSKDVRCYLEQGPRPQVRGPAPGCNIPETGLHKQPICSM